MPDVVYEVVPHDGGWAYKVGDVFSERYVSHDEARLAAARAASRHRLEGDTQDIEYQDRKGDVRRELAPGEDRPDTAVREAGGGAAKAH